MNQPVSKKLDYSIFIRLIKGELINNEKYKHHYQSANNGWGKGTTIYIRGFEITSIFLDEKIDYPYSIHISDSRIGGIYIKSGNFKSFSLNNVTIEEDGQFEIDGGTFEKLYFSGAVSRPAYINSGRFDSLYFGNTAFAQSLTIHDGVFNEVYFSGVQVKGLFIRGGKFSILRIAGGAHINDCVIAGLYFSGGEFNSVQVYGLSAIITMYVTSGTFNSILLASDGLLEVNINGSSHLYAIEGKPEFEKPLVIDSLFIAQLGKINANIKHLRLGLLSFSDAFLSKDAIIRFNDLTVGILKFNNFINYGQITFNKLRNINAKKIDIKHSDIGKTTFINCLLQESALDFESSKITELFITGTTMPEEIIGAPEDKRLAYGQIKKVYENRGDTIGANFFFAKEMNSYNDTLSWRHNKWEKINVLLNKFSTNHGQSWERGLLSTLIVSILLYCFYIYLLGFRLDLSAGISKFINLWSYFFEFINPVHKTDYIVDALHLKQSNTSSFASARLCEGFARIPIAYLIYQLIQAFRKHGKK